MATFPLLTSNQLGRMLQTARKARKLSQAQVGARLDLSQKRISALELDPGSISVDQLLRWCAAVGLALEIGTKPEGPPSGEPIEPTSSASLPGAEGPRKVEW